MFNVLYTTLLVIIRQGRIQGYTCNGGGVPTRTRELSHFSILNSRVKNIKKYLAHPSVHKEDCISGPKPPMTEV